jgi:flagellar hook protein FlgE
MGFQTGLSGLNSSSQALDVIGNNIANSNTVGFKQASGHFADLYAASLNGGGTNQIGIGSTVAAVAQQFTQGNVNTTNNPLDVALNGAGFFRLSNNGTTSYTRNGQFHLDKTNKLVNDQGYTVQGWIANSAGTVVPGTPGDLVVDKSYQAPLETGKGALNPGVQAQLNLDSRDKNIDVTTLPFNPSNPDTFNWSTGLTIYDSRGNPHTLTTFYVKTDPATNPPTTGEGSVWRVYATVDGKNGMAASTEPNGTSAYAGAITFAGATITDPDYATLEFSSGGQLVLPDAVNMPTINLAWGNTAAPTPGLDLSLGVTSPTSFTLNYKKTTSYGDAFGSNSLLQDGYATGKLTGVSVNSDGMVQGSYSNGQTRNMGQIVLYDFANPNGLQPIGNNQWQETFTSGQPVAGAARTGHFGSLQSNSVEDSNVDLTAEMVKMIVQQRNYQANAQTIKTQDSVLQTLVNLR